MLINDFHMIGNKMYEVRKRRGMTQMEAAVAAEVSERTYADIERGTVNMRMGTFLRICQALHVRPDEILMGEDEGAAARQDELLAKLETCPPKDRETALKLLAVFLERIDS